MLKTIKINFLYYLNYSPIVFRLKINKYVFCKNFYFLVLFFFFFSYFCQNNILFFLKKKKKKVNSILKSPNRHKKAQLSLTSSFYVFRIEVSLIFKKFLFFFKNFNFFFFFFLKFFNFIVFDSTLMILTSRSIVFYF